MLKDLSMPSVDGAETIAAADHPDRDGSGSRAAFSAARNRLSSSRAAQRRWCENGSRVMIPAGRLSMVAAYAAFAFVGAIVVGLL
ncbi:hypothetical protein [Bradyrhizobium sp. HKCCYLS20291]|uniref:hypothetical protein n=1 Tax=Bradyrhizobium sp. HKCCYLS20291 TaxID=3420766 RepID=UPI003EB6E13D